MSFTAAQQAMVDHLYRMPDRPNIKVPKGPNVGLPRYVVQQAGGSTLTMGLTLATDAKPEIMVRVETVDGGDYREANDLAARLEAHFAAGTTFDGVTIETAPYPREAMNDGAVHAVPMMIRGRAFY